MNPEYYRAYLRRLANLVYQELVPKAAVFGYFTHHLNRYEEDPLEVEPLLWFFRSGLRYDLTLSLSRLLDKKAGRSIYHFLKYTKKHAMSLPQKDDSVNEKLIESHFSLLDGAKDVIHRLRKRRNKFFAHYDKEFFFEPDLVNKKFPFTNEDGIDLVRLLQQIIGDYYSTLFGAGLLSMEEAFYRASEVLYAHIKTRFKE